MVIVLQQPLLTDPSIRVDPIRRPYLPAKAFAVRLLLAVMLLFVQHGAVLHAYSHFGLVPDPYAIGDTTQPAQGCDVGVVHAALDGDPPSTVTLFSTRFALPVPQSAAVTAFTPLSLRSFQSRAPPARA